VPTALPYPGMPWYETDVAALPPVQPRPIPVAVGGRSLVLVAWDDAWYALEDRCSHAGCAFSEDGAVENARMICDCHGSEFDLATGGVRRPPALASVATFKVRTTGTALEIFVP
jgi:nitrite reductase/ring-hydroxylating ferredoxin subunit